MLKYILKRDVLEWLVGCSPLFQDWPFTGAFKGCSEDVVLQFSSLTCKPGPRLLLIQLNSAGAGEKILFQSSFRATCLELFMCITEFILFLCHCILWC